MDLPYPHDASILIQQQEDSDNDSTPSKRSGKRKIKIEYIQDKSRRHITFSKRKAGIMKKAYELSTLTGTQVLLLVVSETGLVYTFTTPKLQPIVTNPEGKNLIQSCLNTSEEEPHHTTVVKSEPCDPVYNVPVIKYNTTTRQQSQQQNQIHPQESSQQHSPQHVQEHTNQMYGQSPLSQHQQQQQQQPQQHHALSSQHASQIHHNQSNQLHHQQSSQPHLLPSSQVSITQQQQQQQQQHHHHVLSSQQTSQLHPSQQPTQLHHHPSSSQSHLLSSSQAPITHLDPHSINPPCPTHSTADMYQPRYFQGDYNTPPTPYPSYNNYPTPYQ